MKVTQSTAESTPVPLPLIFLLALLALLVLACSDKNEQPAPVPDPVPSASTPAPEPAIPVTPNTLPVDATDTVAVATSAALPPLVEKPALAGPAKPAFVGKPSLKAWPGQPYQFQIRMKPPRTYRFRLAKGPEGMVVSESALSWTPTKPGRYGVVLVASWQGAGSDSGSVTQAFEVEVQSVFFTLTLKALPAEAGKGDTLEFDLRGSQVPDWTLPQIVVRFDFDGDGTWDTPVLPFRDHQVRRHAYAAVGRYRPRVEARYLDLETRSAEGAVAVVGAVDARLVLRPDTVEPGGKLEVDAAASKGDGRLVYKLDLNGDGKPEWADSASGKATLKAPASGRYTARLTVRNAMGQEGKAEAPLLVNSRVRAALRLKAAKAHMAEAVEAAIEAIDADDSLRTLRLNFTGAPEGWTTASIPDSAKGPGRWRKAFKHVYGKTGTFTVEGCALAADGRSDCRKSQVVIFNAPPVCKPGADLKVVVGTPTEIEGAGEDPDGSIVKWEWDLDGDGKFDVASKKDGKVKYTFAKKGAFALGFRVTTADGKTATGTRKVEVRKP